MNPAPPSTVIPNEYSQEAFKTLVGGAAGGLAFQLAGDGYSTVGQFLYHVVVFAFLLAFVASLFWFADERLYPTDNSTGDQ